MAPYPKRDLDDPIVRHRVRGRVGPDLKPGEDEVVRELVGSVLLARNANVEKDGALLDLLERVVLEVPLEKRRTW